MPNPTQATNTLSMQDPQPQVLPGMITPAATTPPVDEVNRFEDEGGKPAQTPREQKERIRAERKVRLDRCVAQVKSVAHSTQDGCQRLLCSIRDKPLRASVMALGLGWLLGRYWPRR